MRASISRGRSLTDRHLCCAAPFVLVWSHLHCGHLDASLAHVGPEVAKVISTNDVRRTFNRQSFITLKNTDRFLDNTAFDLLTNRLWLVRAMWAPRASIEARSLMPLFHVSESMSSSGPTRVLESLRTQFVLGTAPGCPRVADAHWSTWETSDQLSRILQGPKVSRDPERKVWELLTDCWTPMCFILPCTFTVFCLMNVRIVSKSSLANCDNMSSLSISSHSLPFPPPLPGKQLK